jgi:uncharacterized protein (DUF1501 family)
VPCARPFLCASYWAGDIARKLSVGERTSRWIPTTSIEQYGATLAKWFGIPLAALAQVFPNLGAFANTGLGFLG